MTPTKKQKTYVPDNKVKPKKCKGCGCKVAPWNTYCAECLCEEDCAP